MQCHLVTCLPQSNRLCSTWQVCSSLRRRGLRHVCWHGCIKQPSPAAAAAAASQGVLLPHLKDIAGGIAYLHEQNVLHNDIKPSNILLTRPCPSGAAAAGGAPGDPSLSDISDAECELERQLVCKISDLGLSRIMSPDETHCETKNTGTVTHMAPEVIQDGRVSQAGDVYSFGIMSKWVQGGAPQQQRYVGKAWANGRKCTSPATWLCPSITGVKWILCACPGLQSRDI